MLALPSVATLGFVLTFVGKLMVGFTAIRVHHRYWKEHKVDEAVFREMEQERNIGLFGMALMLIGFILEFPSRLV